MIENDEPPLRLLIVENEPLIAVLLHAALREAGLVVVGPAFNQRQAELLASHCDIDGALLDVYLDSGDSTLSVVRILRERRIPFMFVTGGALDGIPGIEGGPGAAKTGFRSRNHHCRAEDWQSAGEFSNAGDLHA